MHLAYSSNAYLNFSIEETIARIAGLGYAGLELLADVPHAWPAGLLDERKRAIRECLDRHRLAISNINAFMMHAVADPRQPYWHPSWIEPDSALPRHPPGTHRPGTAAGQGVGRRVDPDRARRTAGRRPIVGGRGGRVLRGDHAVRGAGRAVGGVSADRAGAGPADRDGSSSTWSFPAGSVRRGWG